MCSCSKNSTFRVGIQFLSLSSALEQLRDQREKSVQILLERSTEKCPFSFFYLYLGVLPMCLVGIRDVLPFPRV